MDELRQKIFDIKEAENYEEHRIDKVNSSVMSSAVVKYHPNLGDTVPSLIEIVFYAHIDRTDLDNISASSNYKSIVSEVGRNNRIYKYLFVLLRTVSNINEFKCQEYISDSGTTNIECNGNMLEVTLNLRKEIIKDV